MAVGSWQPGGAGEMKTVPSVEYTVIKIVDIESERGFGRGRDFFKIARARAVERFGCCRRFEGVLE